MWRDPSIATRRAVVAGDGDTDSGASYGHALSWAAGKGPGPGERDGSVAFDVDGAKLNVLVVDRRTRAVVAR